MRHIGALEPAVRIASALSFGAMFGMEEAPATCEVAVMRRRATSFRTLARAAGTVSRDAIERLRTSCATTANPLPASPAWTASMAAFSVCPVRGFGP